MGEFLNGKGNVAVFTSDGHEQQSFSYNKEIKDFEP